MKAKQNTGLSDERKQLIQKKIRQLTGLTSGDKASVYHNGDGSINIEKLTRVIATTNSLARHRDQVAEYIKSIFERDKRANEIIAEELQNFNVREVQK
jgi:bifunctional DNA-binding transcriptional regulator/antitoxin component of YhaV-PrlF toxin-antitoxin module